MFRKASNNRNWKDDVSRTPNAELYGNILTINNIRNNRYSSSRENYETIWENRHYDLTKIRRLWFLLEPFHPNIRAIAHTFLSFEFEDDFISLSIEARLTNEQQYSIVKGLFGNFELIYSFGDERDFIIRRTCYLEHELYLYPLITPPLEVLTLFLSVIARTNALSRQAGFYNSLTDNCTNTLRKHANQVRPGSFPPFMLADILPGRADKILSEKKWIAGDQALNKLREKHSIREKACTYKDDDNFSRLIRKGML